MALLSVILPSYNEVQMIGRAADTLGRILKDAQIAYELIFVDDGSRDGTWEQIEKVHLNDLHVHGVRFSRNFGKEAAIAAGLAQAKGDCAVVMDCDLQHPAEMVPVMYQKWQEGYEVVEGVKRSRGEESKFHEKAANGFYWLISKAAKIDMTRASDFKLLDRKVIDSLVGMSERNGFFRAMSSWVGYRSIQVEFDVQQRTEGESKWSTWGLVKYAVNNIAGYSTAPMQLVTGAGVGVLIFAVILGIQTLVRYFTGNAVSGFTTVILLILLLGSIVMISLGIIGYYIAKIYEEVKGRPRYLVSKEI